MSYFHAATTSPLSNVVTIPPFCEDMMALGSRHVDAYPIGEGRENALELLETSTHARGLPVGVVGQAQ